MLNNYTYIKKDNEELFVRMAFLPQEGKSVVSTTRHIGKAEKWATIQNALDIIKIRKLKGWSIYKLPLEHSGCLYVLRISNNFASVSGDVTSDIEDAALFASVDEAKEFAKVKYVRAKSIVSVKESIWRKWKRDVLGVVNS